MSNRFSLHPLAVPTLSAMLAFTGLAHANNDDQANELREAAIFDDYLNLRFEEAEAKLTKAIELCESGCSNSVKARLHRDLGVVYIAGLKQREAGVGMFVEAVTLERGIQLDPDLSSEELQQALEEARGMVGDAPPPPPDEPSRGRKAKQPAPKSHDLLPVSDYEGVFHTPPDEQLVHTPLPIYVEVHDDGWAAKVASVKLHYRGFGMVRFKEVKMPRVGKGYGFVIPCEDVGSSLGKVDYYVVITDSDGDVAADIGTERSPHSVAIREEIDYSPQPLPGEQLPMQCDKPVEDVSSGMSVVGDEDCPPDFPGCGGAGDEFSTDGEFDPELPEHMQYSRHWITLGGQLDFLLMNAAPDACTGNFTSELHCFQGDTYWDPRVPGRTNDFDMDGVIDGGGSTTGGFAMATKRFYLGYDYAFTQNFLAGVRLGFATGGGPKLVDQDPFTADDNPEFLPLHAELRAAYWFGSGAHLDQVFQPFIQASGGVAQVDAGLDTEVVDLSEGRTCVATPDPSTGAPVMTCRVPVTAWRKTGTFFVGAGVGGAIAFTKDVRLLLEARFMQLLPASGSALGLGGGLQVGF